MEEEMLKDKIISSLPSYLKKITDERKVERLISFLSPFLAKIVDEKKVDRFIKLFKGEEKWGEKVWKIWILLGITALIVAGGYFYQTEFPFGIVFGILWIVIGISWIAIALYKKPKKAIK
jgi:uncharacterized membrane protein